MTDCPCTHPTMTVVADDLDLWRCDACGALFRCIDQGRGCEDPVPVVVIEVATLDWLFEEGG